MVIVVAVVVVLALLAAGLWFMRESQNDAAAQTTPPVPPKATDSAPTQPGDEDPPETEESVIVSPSGNITCEVSEERARCLVSSFDFNPPVPPDNCTWNGYGSAVEVDEEGSRLSCEENDVDTSDAQTLDYGEELTVGDVTCASSESGIRCEKAASGFTIARAGISTF